MRDLLGDVPPSADDYQSANRDTPQRYELAFLVVDRSGSMTLPNDDAGSGDGVPENTPRTRTEEVIDHLIVRNDCLIQKLASLRNARGFYLGLMAFDEELEGIFKSKLLIDPNRQKETLRITPRQRERLKATNPDRQTNIGLALDAAWEFSWEWVKSPPGLSPAEQQKPRFATILIFSDGLANLGPNPEDVANRIKNDPRNDTIHWNGAPRKRVTIATAAYGAEASKGTNFRLLEKIASGPEFSAKVYNGSQLVDFFVKSLATSLQ